MASRKPQNRRLRRNTAADYVLEVSTKSSSARRRRRRRILGWCVRLFLLVGIGIAAFYGVRAAMDRFFFTNPDYTLRKIELELDGVITREELLGDCGLREGGNIFAIDLASVEKTLRRVPMVRNVVIERILPDTISIRLESRDPVAWVAVGGETGDLSASSQSLLVDAAGTLMRPRRILPEFLMLPAIYGVENDALQDGSSLQNEDFHASLQLLAEVAARPECLLRIRSIDLSRGYRMDVITDQNAHIIFSTTDLGQQLDRLQQLLAHCAESGRLLESVNLMVRRNTPVTFVMASTFPSPFNKPDSPNKTH